MLEVQKKSPMAQFADYPEIQRIISRVMMRRKAGEPPRWKTGEQWPEYHPWFAQAVKHKDPKRPPICKCGGIPQDVEISCPFTVRHSVTGDKDCPVRWTTRDRAARTFVVYRIHVKEARECLEQGIVPDRTYTPTVCAGCRHPLASHQEMVRQHRARDHHYISIECVLCRCEHPKRDLAYDDMRKPGQ